MTGMDGTDKSDEQRLLALFDDYAPAIKALLCRMVRSEDVAEDLLADCFVTAWKKIPLFNGDLFPALVQTARAHALAWVRANGAPVSIEDRPPANPFLPDSPLGILPVMQRLAIEHVLFEGGSISLFARKMNMPRERAVATLRHALSTVWEEYKNYGTPNRL